MALLARTHTTNQCKVRTSRIRSMLSPFDAIRLAPRPSSSIMLAPPAKPAMPTISSFYGILIRMYFFDAEQHHMPHIHAQYQGRQAQFAIDSGEVLAGALPRAQTRLVQAWIEIHQDELMAAWQMAVNGFRPGKIAPLQ